MATKVSTIDYLLDQLASIPDIRARKMFGEYALYCGDKVVALVCDDEMFVKITDVGKEFVGDQYQEGNAYRGAKPSMRIDMDMAENRDWLCELIMMTEEALPIPVRKKRIKK
jgi:TfoX/Sxy family transcriptional regulator of competence genes